MIGLENGLERNSYMVHMMVLKEKKICVSCNGLKKTCISIEIMTLRFKQFFGWFTQNVSASRNELLVFMCYLCMDLA